MDTKKEIESIKSLVKELMEEDSRCREDDKWLTFRVMRQYSNVYIPFEDFDKLPSFETISRVRRKIQADGQLLASAKVQAQRKEREDVFREEMV